MLEPGGHVVIKGNCLQSNNDGKHFCRQLTTLDTLTEQFQVSIGIKIKLVRKFFRGGRSD